MSNESMDNQPMDMENMTTDTAFMPGASLKREREALGLTEDEVAIQLHLSKHMIEALEADAYDKLPGLTFVRGYLRGYAKLLNISAEEHIAAFNKLFPYTRENAPFVKREHQKIVIKHKRIGEEYTRWIGYGIIGILVILVFIWWHNHNAQQDAMPATQTEITNIPVAPVVNTETANTVETTPATTEQQTDVATMPAAVTNETADAQPGTAVATTPAVETPGQAAVDATTTQTPAATTPAAAPSRWQKAKKAIWRNPDAN